MEAAAAYGGLFATAFLAATVLLTQSEAVLVGPWLAGHKDPALLFAVASFGNVLGSVANWLLDSSPGRLRDQRWFPAGPDALASAQRWYRRWGRWGLLLSWLPILGDPLTISAGVMRELLGSFLLLFVLAQIGRYLLLA